LCAYNSVNLTDCVSLFTYDVIATTCRDVIVCAIYSQSAICIILYDLRQFVIIVKCFTYIDTIALQCAVHIYAAGRKFGIIF